MLALHEHPSECFSEPAAQSSQLTCSHLLFFGSPSFRIFSATIPLTVILHLLLYLKMIPCIVFTVIQTVPANVCFFFSHHPELSAHCRPSFLLSLFRDFERTSSSVWYVLPFTTAPHHTSQRQCLLFHFVSLFARRFLCVILQASLSSCSPTLLHIRVILNSFQLPIDGTALSCFLCCPSHNRFALPNTRL